MMLMMKLPWGTETTTHTTSTHLTTFLPWPLFLFHRAHRYPRREVHGWFPYPPPTPPSRPPSSNKATTRLQPTAHTSLIKHGCPQAHRLPNRVGNTLQCHP